MIGTRGKLCQFICASESFGGGAYFNRFQVYQSESKEGSQADWMNWSDLFPFFLVFGGPNFEEDPREGGSRYREVSICEVAGSFC